MRKKKNIFLDSGQSCKRMDIEDSDVEPELMELEGKPT